MVEFSKEKTERLIERAKELMEKEKYNLSQISKTFGVAEDWFVQHMPQSTKPKAKTKATRKKHWYE